VSAIRGVIVSVFAGAIAIAAAPASTGAPSGSEAILSSFTEVDWNDAAERYTVVLVARPWVHDSEAARKFQAAKPLSSIANFEVTPGAKRFVTLAGDYLVEISGSGTQVRVSLLPPGSSEPLDARTLPATVPEDESLFIQAMGDVLWVKDYRLTPQDGRWAVTTVETPDLSPAEVARAGDRFALFRYPRETVGTRFALFHRATKKTGRLPGPRAH
jgi:hypothetical protein